MVRRVLRCLDRSIDDLIGILVEVCAFLRRFIPWIGFNENFESMSPRSLIVPPFGNSYGTSSFSPPRYQRYLNSVAQQVLIQSSE